MKSYHFKLIREMVMYSKADMSAFQVDPWAIFREIETGSKSNKAKALWLKKTRLLDESMSNYKPRKDKPGGLPNIY
jgi:hypothetical protein